jgi:beta-lactamase regulating signal transducer with metallopeptidase domain
VPIAFAAALAAGVLAVWLTAVVLGQRAGPLARYAVWLSATAIVLGGTLAPLLHAAQTCGPVGVG